MSELSDVLRGVGLRSATAADLGFLVEMRRTTMRRHVEGAGLVYEEGDQLRRVEYKFECARIVVLDGEAVGLLKVDQKVLPWDLVQIQLLPAFQGRGIGAELVRRVLSEAGAQGADVGLTVLNGNPARALYERLGFVVTKEGAHAAQMLWTHPDFKKGFSDYF